jgi:hypothetical protein
MIIYIYINYHVYIYIYIYTHTHQIIYNLISFSLFKLLKKHAFSMFQLYHFIQKMWL